MVGTSGGCECEKTVGVLVVFVGALVLAMSNIDEAAQVARRGTVAALTPDWDTCLLSANEGPSMTTCL